MTLCSLTPGQFKPFLFPPSIYFLPSLQYVSDTFSLTGAAYLMEGVEQLSRSLRQKDDAVNKMMGGVAAGGMLGYMCKCGEDGVCRRGAQERGGYRRRHVLI